MRPLCICCIRCLQVMHCGQLPEGGTEVGLGPSSALEWQLLNNTNSLLSGSSVKVSLHWEGEQEEIECVGLEYDSDTAESLVGAASAEGKSVMVSLECEQRGTDTVVQSAAVLWPEDAEKAMATHSQQAPASEGPERR